MDNLSRYLVNELAKHSIPLKMSDTLTAWTCAARAIGDAAEGVRLAAMAARRYFEREGRS